MLKRTALKNVIKCLALAIARQKWLWRIDATQCNTEQHTIQDSTAQNKHDYNYNAVQCHGVQDNTMQYNAMQCNTIQ